MAITKENRAGEQQPYIPPGNGDKSGQYTFKNDNSFGLSESCSELELKKILTDLEYKSIYYYSSTINGKLLNKGIRENNLSNFGILIKDLIISAINKYSLKNEIVVYRGISVNRQTYLNNFYQKYINKELITGSLICSTSRSLERAVRASKSDVPFQIPIVFEIKLPKGYKALPIENIALCKDEQEILISSPLYRIAKIEDINIKYHHYKKIIIDLVR